MANAVTFWKGSATAFAGKTIVDGRIYFVNDDDNLGSLYLGVASGETVKAVMISPKRLTELALDTTDATSTVTAKAVVDFVKANFDSKGAYDGAISTINGLLSGFEGEGAVKAAIDAKVAQSAYDVDKAATDAILAGYGAGEGQIATVKEDIEAVKAIAAAAMEFKGVKATFAELPTEGVENGDIYYVTADDTEYVYIADKEVVEGDSKWEALGGYVKADVYTKTETDKAIDDDVKAAKDVIDAYTVNGKAISTSPVLTGDDIKVGTFDTEDAVTTINGETTLSGAIKALDEAISGVTGGSGGEGGSLAGKMDKVSASDAGKVIIASNTGNAEASSFIISSDEAIAGVDTASATKLVNEKAVAKAISAAEGRVKETTDGLAERLTATEGVANGAAAAVATKVGQEAFNTYKGEVEEEFNGVAEELADRYTKSEVYTKDEVDGAISAAALVWIED